MSAGAFGVYSQIWANIGLREPHVTLLIGFVCHGGCSYSCSYSHSYIRSYSYSYSHSHSYSCTIIGTVIPTNALM